MNATPQRNENSVQMSLTQLRQLHTTRIETAQQEEERRSLALEAQRVEAEKRRLDEERAAEEKRMARAFEQEQKRLAAQHELELAKERARVEAEARVREKQLELQIKQTDGELIKAQAMAPKQRSWLGMTMVALLLLGLQGGLFWLQARADQRVDAVHETARENQRDSYDAAKTISSLEKQLNESQRALSDATDRMNALQTNLKALQDWSQTLPKRYQPSKKPVVTNNNTTTNTKKPPGPVEVGCTHSPLC